MTNAYNRVVKARVFTIGQIILKAFNHMRKNIVGPSNFAVNWDNPFIVAKAYYSRYYCLKTHEEESLLDIVNAKWLKTIYC
ncbi:hypothetical protein SLEP1_g26069 [Rubroshorea leprosula]|uniref:Uncharacterized protein n=1 Tax=Rubroshorea leprosula TaxID=152421 RepID=A0AAV5JUL6_9ROSI|nr:hypothetical protein SLEP1_g26069 [Rubroshorea leprosula]